MKSTLELIIALVVLAFYGWGTMYLQNWKAQVIDDAKKLRHLRRMRLYAVTTRHRKGAQRGES